MTEQDIQRLLQENAYLKLRCAQLQGDVTDLSAEVDRLRQQQERTYARRLASTPPNPLSGGQ